MSPPVKNDILRIGITGQAGFIGSHLFNWLNLFPEKFETRPFSDDFFSSAETLRNWVSGCDVIVHLAALNRHNDPEVEFLARQAGAAEFLHKNLTDAALLEKVLLKVLNRPPKTQTSPVP